MGAFRAVKRRVRGRIDALGAAPQRLLLLGKGEFRRRLAAVLARFCLFVGAVPGNAHAPITGTKAGEVVGRRGLVEAAVFRAQVDEGVLAVLVDGERDAEFKPIFGKIRAVAVFSADRMHI